MIKFINKFIKFFIQHKFYKNYFNKNHFSLYLGDATYHNLGDKMLFLAIKKLLSPIVLIPKTPKISRYQALNSITDVFIQAMFKGFKSCDSILLGGGTLLNNNNYCYMLNQVKYDLFFMFGPGFEDHEDFDNVLKYRKIFINSVFNGVRDGHAQKMLKSCGIDSVVIGDPVLSLCTPITKTNISNRIGINIGYDAFTIGDQMTFFDELYKFMRYLLKNNWKIEFFSMNSRDDEEIYAFLNKYKISRIKVWNNYQNINEFINKVKDYDVIIGQRLHSVVVACGLSIPCISINYQTKCLHFMESMKMEKYVVNMDSFMYSYLTNAFNNLIDDYYTINKNLISSSKYYKEMQLQSAHFVYSSIVNYKK